VMFNGMHHTHGESVPPTEGGLMKFNCEVSFTNNQYHVASKQTFSVPPIPLSQSTWSHDVPDGLKEDILLVIKHIYGSELAGLEVESYRMCWDAVTPNQDFIISPHPHCRNLSIASGGSFHSWKFAPCIGKYVVQMLEGKLDEEKTRRWAWDRDDDGAANIMYIPTRDLKDVGGFSKISQV